MNRIQTFRAMRWRQLLAVLGLIVVASVPVQAKDDAHLFPNSSYIRFLQALPGAPKVDVYVDGRKLVNDLTFGSTTKYIRISAGRHRIETRLNNSNVTTFVSARNTARNNFYTAALYTTRNRGRMLFQNESAGYNPPNRARLFLYHLSPGAPAVNVVAVSSTGRVATLTRGLRFGQVRSVLVPAGSYSMQIRVGSRIIKTVTDLGIQAPRRYAAFVKGRVGAGGDNAFRVDVDVAASQ